jgi:hypothetical protein
MKGQLKNVNQEHKKKMCKCFWSDVEYIQNFEVPLHSNRDFKMVSTWIGFLYMFAGMVITPFISK